MNKTTITPELIYNQTTPLAHRKKFAQFFTPPAIADLMADWLMGNPDLHDVLEPAFGLGIFSRMLLAKSSNVAIKGFEIDNRIFGNAQNEFSSCPNINLQLQDYMYNDWENKYDGIICNPPYFKFHDYDNKKIITEIEDRLSCKLNGFTNLYTLFLLKSIYQLKPNGRCAYIIPSEFLNSDYGKLVKAHLLKTRTLRYIFVFDFEENVFNDSTTTACIILCANDTATDKLQFTNIHFPNDLNLCKDMIANYPKVSNYAKAYEAGEINPLEKWKIYYQSHSKNNFKNLIPFSTYAKVMRGIATGANDFFTFNISKAKKYGIDEKYLLPCVCRSADIKGHTFTMPDFECLKDADKKIFILNAKDACDSNVTEYLKKGENEGIDKKHLTASRKPWYALEKRPPSPIWVSVFNRNGLRFIRNVAEVSNLTTFHCIYLRNGIFSDIPIDLFFAYLLTDTAKQIFENNAREYGNGLQKFEPNDLNHGMVLDIASLPDSAKKQILALYLACKQSCDSNIIIKRIDDILLEYFSCGN